MYSRKIQSEQKIGSQGSLNQRKLSTSIFKPQEVIDVERQPKTNQDVSSSNTPKPTGKKTSFLTKFMDDQTKRSSIPEIHDWSSWPPQPIQSVTSTLGNAQISTFARNGQNVVDLTEDIEPPWAIRPPAAQLPQAQPKKKSMNGEDLLRINSEKQFITSVIFKNPVTPELKEAIVPALNPPVIAAAKPPDTRSWSGKSSTPSYKEQMKFFKNQGKPKPKGASIGQRIKAAEQNHLKELYKIKNDAAREQQYKQREPVLPQKRNHQERAPKPPPPPVKRPKGSSMFTDLLKGMENNGQPAKPQPATHHSRSTFDDQSLSNVLELQRQKNSEREGRYSKRNDLSVLYNYVLTIDIFDFDKNRVRIPAQSIPIEFSDGQDYIEAFQALYLEESREELKQAVACMNFSQAVRLKLYHKQGNLMENSLMLQAEDQLEFSDRFKPDDLVLIIEESATLPRKFKDWQKPTALYFLALVECREYGQSYLRAFHDNVTLGQIRQQPSYYVIPVDSMITLIREFKMINLAEFLDLGRYILQPGWAFSTSPSVISTEFFENIQKYFNASQYAAIEKVWTQDRGFTLLQGPPGTGKTHTILGVLSAFSNCEPLSGDRPYILVCAPSNAAIDEVAMRVLRIGLLDVYGNTRKNLRLVRIGSRSQNMMALRARKDAREQNYAKQDVPDDLNQIYLASLVQEMLDRESGVHNDAELRSTQERIQAITKALDEAKRKNEGFQKIQALEAMRLEIKGKQSLALNHSESNRIKRFKLEKDIINNADIIFTTCSMAGGREFEKINHAFDYVIIDEACQSIELSALIPLQYNAKKVVLVGDPKQLPATIFSQRASRRGLNQSLFERMSKAGCETTMLEIQYRMMPEIR